MTIETSDASHLGTYRVVLEAAIDDWPCLTDTPYASCTPIGHGSRPFKVEIGASADICTTGSYLIDDSILPQLEYNYTLGNVATVIILDPSAIDLPMSSCPLELFIDMVDGSILDPDIFSYDSTIGQLTIFNDLSSTAIGSYNLRVRASFTGKTSGDGHKVFKVNLKRPCNERTVTVETNFITDSIFYYEIGVDSSLQIPFDLTAVKFDGETGECTTTILPFFEDS